MYYILYAGRYSACFFSVLLEERRSDFLAMQLHHVSTATLVLVSYEVGFLNIGTVVMLLLDVADPPLHVAKIFLYLR